jgi:type II secretory pathway component PulF
LLMVKTSLKKIDKSMKLPSMFFLFNFVVYACLLGFIFPRK